MFYLDSVVRPRSRQVRESSPVAPGSFRSFIQPRLARTAFLVLLTLAGASAAVRPAVAQEDPFGTGEPAAKPSTTGAGGAAKPDDGPIERDPVVLSVRSTNPTTAEQLARAIRIMLDLGRPDEAKRYMTRLKAAAPDDPTWAALHARYGSSQFLRWTSDPNLQPEGAALGRAAMEAARRQAEDPQRLRSLVTRLTSPDQATRRGARLALRDAGTAAVGPLVTVLADDARGDEHAAAQAMLVELGQSTVEPLLGVLESNQLSLNVRVMGVLGALRARRAVPYLVRPSLAADTDDVTRQAATQAIREIVGATPTEYDAMQFLYRRALASLKGELPVRPDADDMAERWHWDAANKAPVRREYASSDLAVVEAARLARELYLLKSDSPEYRRLYVGTMLEAAKIDSGVDETLTAATSPAFDTAAKLGVDVIEDVLADTLKRDRPLAAAAAADVLGQIGTVDLVASSDGRPRALAAALAYPDRRVRFAATAAVVKLDPKQPFAGASYLAESIGFFAGTVGSRRVLIAHPDSRHGQSMVGQLAELGIASDSVRTGRAAMLAAVKQPDYEFVLISDSIQSPPVSELVQALRQESRTGRLPVGIVASSDDLERGRRIADRETLTEAFPQPYDVDAMAFVVGRMEKRLGRNAVSREQRLIQAALALEWAGRMLEAESIYGFYELSRQQPAFESALQTPELGTRAAQALGYIGTPRAQAALVELASQQARPVLDRQAAVRAFAVAIQRRTLLLTRDEISRQYVRYNQSESLDRETQQVLGTVLDVIEAPTRSIGPAETSQ